MPPLFDTNDLKPGVSKMLGSRLIAATLAIAALVCIGAALVQTADAGDCAQLRARIQSSNSYSSQNVLRLDSGNHYDSRRILLLQQEPVYREAVRLRIVNEHHHDARQLRIVNDGHHRQTVRLEIVDEHADRNRGGFLQRLRQRDNGQRLRRR